MNTLKEKCKILKDKFDIDYFCLTMIDDDNRSIISNIDEFDEVYISEKNIQLCSSISAGKFTG